MQARTALVDDGQGHHRQPEEHTAQHQEPAAGSATAEPGGERRDEQAADPDGRGQHTDAVGAHAQVVGHEDLHHLLEAEEEHRGRGEADECHEPRFGPDHGQPLHHAAPQALVNLRDHQLRHLRRPAPALAVHASRVPSAPHRAGLQHQCRRDQERDGVDRERRARVGDGHDQRAQGRPGEVGDLGHDALEGVGGGEIVLAHQRRRGRDGRRPVRHRADRAGDGQRDREGRRAVRPGHHRQHDHDRGAGDVQPDEQPEAIEPVRHHPAERAQEDIGQHAGDGGRSDPPGGPGGVVQQDDERDEVEEVARRRHRVAGQQPPPPSMSPGAPEGAGHASGHRGGAPDTIGSQPTTAGRTDPSVRCRAGRRRSPGGGCSR